MAKTKDFAKVIAKRLQSDDGLADAIERERLNGDIAVLIYSERRDAGLTQSELAEKCGTHQSVIARVENAEYDGRSIELLRRVLRALGRRLSVSAEPLVEDSVCVNISSDETISTAVGPSEPLKIWTPSAETEQQSTRIVSAIQATNTLSATCAM